jgi:regulator of nucleoside diphosphate kinase
MPSQQIFITTADAAQLRMLLQKGQYSDYRNTDYLRALADEVERARIVPPEQIPPDVITLNSRVRLRDEATGDEMVFTLVFPDEADFAQGKISVLAPLGTGMLGYRVGDSFTWDTPGGPRTWAVEAILFQPEAAQKDE